MKVFLNSLFATGVLTFALVLNGEDAADSKTTIDESDKEKVEEVIDDKFDEIDQKIEKSFARLLRLFGATEEEIERMRKDAIDARANLPPENVRISQGISTLEELIPELEGLSSTWESIDPPTLFAKLTTSIAKYHKFPDDRMKELKTAIETTIDLGTTYAHGSFSVITNHYFRTLVFAYRRLQDDLSALQADKAEVSLIRKDILAINPNTNTKKMDKFISCVDEIHDKADKEFIKLFTSLTKSLQRAVKSADKFQSIDDVRERNLKIDHIIGETLLLGPGSRLWRTSLRITKRNCYARFDVESVREVHQELTSANSHNPE